MTVEQEQLPQALPYLPPSQPLKPVPFRTPDAVRVSTAPARRKQESRNRMRTWFILGGGLLVGTVAIVWEML